MRNPELSQLCFVLATASQFSDSYLLLRELMSQLILMAARANIMREQISLYGDYTQWSIKYTLFISEITLSNSH